MVGCSFTYQGIGCCCCSTSLYHLQVYWRCPLFWCIERKPIHWLNDAILFPLFKKISLFASSSPILSNFLPPPSSPVKDPILKAQMHADFVLLVNLPLPFVLMFPYQDRRLRSVHSTSTAAKRVSCAYLEPWTRNLQPPLLLLLLICWAHLTAVYGHYRSIDNWSKRIMITTVIFHTRCQLSISS